MAMKEVQRVHIVSTLRGRKTSKDIEVSNVMAQLRDEQ